MHINWQETIFMEHAQFAIALSQFLHGAKHLFSFDDQTDENYIVCYFGTHSQTTRTQHVQINHPAPHSVHQRNGVSLADRNKKAYWENITTVQWWRRLSRNDIDVLHDMNHGMRFPTMWYVRPAKAQISLRISAG